MKKLFISCFLSFLFLITYGQYVIEGTIENYQNKRIYLANYFSNQNKVIDSVKTDNKGFFQFNINKNMPAGMYQLILANKSYIDLIFNYENIRLNTTYQKPNEELKIISSNENKLFKDYTFRKNISQYKMDLIKRLINYYPEMDDFLEISKKKYLEIQSAYFSYLDSIISSSPESFTAKLAKFEKPPLLDPELNPFEENLYLKIHYFDHTDFMDTMVLRSNVLPNKLIGYLGLYQNQNLGKEALEKEFIKAVDTILQKTSINQYFYEASLEYLIEGFNMYGFDKVLEYIADHAVLDEFCEYTEKSSELEKRIETLKLLATGKTAPDFTTSDINGNQITLSEIEKDKKLLVFWATWCPHCSSILPDLAKSYEKNMEKLEIIAVSIDTSKSDYQEFISQGDYNWINICDYKGWDNQLAKKYGIYATPTMILLDEELKIISKPGSIRELEKILQE